MSEPLSAEETIEHLFECYADDIYRFARYTIPNGDDARDVVQEVFMRAFRAWNTFRDEANRKTWLFQIARNYMYDLLRKKRTETEYQKRHKPDIRDVSVPLASVIELEDAISQLKPNYRQVFILRCVQDMSIEETAAILGWSQSKVKTTLHRALKELRSALENHEHDSIQEEGEHGERRGKRDSSKIRSTERGKTEQRR